MNLPSIERGDSHKPLAQGEGRMDTNPLLIEEGKTRHVHLLFGGSVRGGGSVVHT